MLMGTGPVYVNNLACKGGECFDCMNEGLGVTGACTYADVASVLFQDSKLRILDRNGL